MKKILVTTALSLACVAAFAQGKVNFVNNSLHCVYFATTYGPGQGLLTGDVAGAAVVAANNISYDLFAGTAQDSLTKVATTTMDGTTAPGTWKTDNTTLPAGIGGGTPQYFEIFAYSTSAGSYTAAAAGSELYYGSTGVFTSTPGSSTLYNSLVQTTAPSFSTWGSDTTLVSGTLANAKGGLAVLANVPEPTSLALFGLGAAGMLIFRRRK